MLWCRALQKTGERLELKRERKRTGIFASLSIEGIVNDVGRQAEQEYRN